MRVTVAHEFLPKTATVRTSRVMDHFGIAFEQGRHVLAENLELPIEPGQVVLFTGESGAGKSSLMRAAATELRNSAEPSGGVLNIDELGLGDEPLIDALPIDAIEAMELLAQCGLGEARLLLRKSAELSDGQRYRFRLALGLAQRPQWLVADEFTATLDRSLAKVVAYNVRRLADRTGIGFLVATTHDDVITDLDPDLHVRCRLDGQIECLRRNAKASPDVEASPPRRKKKRLISFADDLRVTSATRRDWPYFARWHYRSHELPLTRFHTLLWHGAEPIGMCVFSVPPLSLAGRNRFFNKSGKWDRVRMQTLNRQVSMLSRVVLHPTYRGAGIGAAFVRRSCELCPTPWIETLTEMGRINPFFERAGFVRVPVRATAADRVRSRRKHSAIYGGRRQNGRRVLVSKETFEKSRFANPVYYIFDNRRSCEAGRKDDSAGSDSAGADVRPAGDD